MNALERVDCLGVPVACARFEAVREWFFTAIEQRSARSLYFVNAHTLNLAWGDPQFREILGRGDLVLNDGIGLAIYARLAGRRFDYNFNGTDLLPAMFEAAVPARPLGVFLYGAVPGRAELAARNVEQRFRGVQIVGAVDGFVRDGVIERINAASPDVLLVGMGNPLQERWIDQHRAQLDVGVVAGIGALIDFLSGATARAPSWIRAAQMEWAFRLALEPKRMWRRYVLGNPVFLGRSAAYLGGVARPR